MRITSWSTGSALNASAAHLAEGGLLCVNCPDRRGLFYRAADAADAALNDFPRNEVYRAKLRVKEFLSAQRGEED